MLIRYSDSHPHFNSQLPSQFPTPTEKMTPTKLTGKPVEISAFIDRFDVREKVPEIRVSLTSLVQVFLFDCDGITRSYFMIARNGFGN